MANIYRQWSGYLRNGVETFPKIRSHSDGFDEAIQVGKQQRHESVVYRLSEFGSNFRWIERREL